MKRVSHTRSEVLFTILCGIFHNPIFHKYDQQDFSVSSSDNVGKETSKPRFVGNFANDNGHQFDSPTGIFGFALYYIERRHYHKDDIQVLSNAPSYREMNRTVIKQDIISKLFGL